MATYFKGVPNTPRVGREQAETLNRLSKTYGKFGYVPENLSLMLAIGTVEGHISPRYSVTMTEDVAAWMWTNKDEINMTGINGTADRAIFYHAAYDEPLMSLGLTSQPYLRPQDSIQFLPGQIRLSGDAVAMFRWPREDYLINELEEPC